MGRGGQMKIGFNDNAIVEAKKYFGNFALISNQAICAVCRIGLLLLPSRLGVSSK